MSYLNRFCVGLDSVILLTSIYYSDQVLSMKTVCDLTTKSRYNSIKGNGELT